MSRILDLGGHPDIWSHVETPLDITILNLPGNVVRKEGGRHKLSYVEGDACEVEGFPLDAFDVVYSNSVIEHVGDVDKQQAFANQVQKFNAKFWVQTPSKWFPIEAHCGMPLWWFYPSWLRAWFLRRWRPKLPGWTEMVEETRVIESGDLQAMFPGAQLQVERFLGMVKSYIVWTDCR